MKIAGSLLYSIGRILYKKSYLLNADLQETINILKRGFKEIRKRKKAKAKDGNPDEK